MSTYKILRSVLSTVTPKVYADIVSLDAKAPYIRYSQIGGKVQNTVCNTSHIDAIVPLVQVDLHAPDGAQREQMLISLDVAIKHYNATNKGILSLYEAPVLEYDSDTKTFKAILTYQIKA